MFYLYEDLTLSKIFIDYQNTEFDHKCIVIYLLGPLTQGAGGVGVGVPFNKWDREIGLFIPRAVNDR